MYCSLSNYFGPNKFGDHIVLEFCFRYIGYALDVCLNDKEGGSTIFFWRRARMINNYYLLHHINATPVTSILFMHAYLVLNLL